MVNISASSKQVPTNIRERYRNLDLAKEIIANGRETKWSRRNALNLLSISIWSIMAQINLEEKFQNGGLDENQIAIESSNLIREVRDRFMRVSPGGKMENFPE
jgi:hypothetical protein